MDEIIMILLNLLFILVGLLFYQLWYDHKIRSRKEITIGSIILATITIVFSIGFAIQLSNDFLFDLRHIPFWIAGLYGGPLVSIALLLVTVVFRLFLGGLGIWVAAIVATGQAIVCIFAHKKFLSFTSKQRIFWTVGLSTASILSNLIIATIFFYNPIQSAVVILFYLFIHITGTVICVMTIEGMIRNKLLHQKYLKDKKMELATHLASSFGHEIRNPMTTGIGLLQLMKSEDNLSREKQKEYIDIAMAELEQAEKVIQDYLTFAKPSINKAQKLDLKYEFEQSIRVIESMACNKNILIKVKLLESQIIGESKLFQKCLVNLLENAIEAMPDGGVLKIKVYPNEEGQVTILIEDTGVGMSVEQLNRLGEPFFSTKEIKGTGLGMMVVFRIVEIMGGEIKVKSEVNKGTRVFITLPIAKLDEVDNSLAI